MNTIQTFLGEDAKAAVEGNPRKAGKLLAQALDWEVKASFYRSPKFPFLPCENLTSDWDLTHEAELATIEKVAADAYGKALFTAKGYHPLPKEGEDDAQLAYKYLADIATASGTDRIAACLLALST